MRKDNNGMFHILVTKKRTWDFPNLETKSKEESLQKYKKKRKKSSLKQTLLDKWIDQATKEGLGLIKS